MIKTSFIGRGMRLEFGHPECDLIRTSVILDVRSRQAPQPDHITRGAGCNDVVNSRTASSGSGAS